ncbi:MAG: hypothetical protein AAGB22_03375, partial [Bacteroidota bacterium]
MKPFLFLTAVSALLSLGPAFGQQVIQVNAGGSIQQAINSASNGDTVRVAAGTFDESLFINKQIVLQGAGPF